MWRSEQASAAGKESRGLTTSCGSEVRSRNPSKGVLVFVVTITTHKSVQAYPCRTMEKALELAYRFVAGVTKSVR